MKNLITATKIIDGITVNVIDDSKVQILLPKTWDGQRMLQWKDANKEPLRHFKEKNVTKQMELPETLAEMKKRIGKPTAIQSEVEHFDIEWGWNGDKKSVQFTDSDGSSVIYSTTEAYKRLNKMLEGVYRIVG